MTHKMFRKLVHWAGIIILFRIVAALIFSIFLSPQINSSLYHEEFAVAENIHLVYQIAIVFIFSLIYATIERQMPDRQKELKQLMKSPDFKVLNYYRKNYLKEHLFKTALYTAFQLPLTISVALQGYVVGQRTMLERAFAMDSGAYAVTDSAVLGLILNAVIFGVIFMGTYILILLGKMRTEEI